MPACDTAGTARRQWMQTDGCPHVPLQSYGIKVGYGAGSSGGVNLNAGSAAPAKSGCCG